MIMADRRRRLSAAKDISDIAQGDYVRRSLGSRKAGLVETVHPDGYAWVAWEGRREYLPLAALRKIPPVGHKLDSRNRG